MKNNPEKRYTSYRLVRVSPSKERDQKRLARLHKLLLAKPKYCPHCGRETENTYICQHCNYLHCACCDGRLFRIPGHLVNAQRRLIPNDSFGWDDEGFYTYEEDPTGNVRVYDSKADMLADVGIDGSMLH